MAADGSLRLRYGVLLDIRIPAALITGARVERRITSGAGLAQARGDGSLDLSVGGQTTVTVELSEAVRFVRPLGKESRHGCCASTPTIRRRPWPRSPRARSPADLGLRSSCLARGGCEDRSGIAAGPDSA
ncbi:hypothetical protein ACWGLF_30900 [Streptomyces puniciscabiei]